VIAPADRASGWVGRIDALDRAAMAARPGLRRPALDRVAVAITYSGSGPVWFGVATVLVICVHRAIGPGSELRAWLGWMTGSLLSLLVGQVLKRTFRRVRPYQAMADSETLGFRPFDASMPSTHASSATALAVAMTLAGHPWAPVVAVWAVCVALSRYYVGVHYPSDLVAGAALGGAFGAVPWDWLVRRALGG
jgi:undecaprenyl-diphosphatase